MGHQVKIFQEYFRNNLFEENLDAELQVLQDQKLVTASQSFNQTFSRTYLHGGSTFHTIVLYYQAQHYIYSHPTNQSTKGKLVLFHQQGHIFLSCLLFNAILSNDGPNQYILLCHICYRAVICLSSGVLQNSLLIYLIIRLNMKS